MEDTPKQPLLQQKTNDEQQEPEISVQDYFVHRWSTHSFLQSFVDEGDDIPPITGTRQFYKAFTRESKKLWYLAGPAIITSLCQYSLGAITQTFAGHVGNLDLAAFSIENSVIAGLSLGVMLGMGSALETLCGQAYGAGQIEMLGIYMQRSWVILLTTGVLLNILYVFAYPFLRLIGQTEDISRVAGKFSIWMIPQLYAYALNYPIAKFLQAQSKIMVMTWISVVALVLHIFFSWLLMLKLGWGMAGGAVVLNASWWFIVVAQLVYIFSGTCGRAWSGFSWRAFQNLWGFARLSLASAVMLCLETWYFMALILFAGYLKNAEVAVDALSICTNILGWTVMVAMGFNAAISVRVSNELGAEHPRTAKFSVLVVVLSSFVIGLLISIILLIFQKQYPSLFSNSSEVKEVVYQLTPLLAFCIVVNNVQPALSGVAIGAGWQALVAYVNIACYYIFGVPLGLVLGFALNMSVKGIWYGMVSGTLVQTLILFWIVYRTNWNKEASIAAQRIKMWGGEPDANKANQIEK
ncbi:putative membrane protein, predicted efflux pump [Handroanthus impetiginosus]|uniref:Protein DETOXIFICATION n=1 Tax=Handroanthus impetiginosus TaxID=429701 RepID=A0A2G9G9K8_9LAMI|nr:putative membrane protein, predicted efflux pump [Handroanthus impetiginosus]